jgi:hypothetical protein
MKADWGLPTTDPQASYCWGARAIYRLNYEEVTIDIPWDRQAWDGEHSKETRLALSTWINSKAMNQLKKKLSKLGIGGSSEELISIEGDGFRLSASPKASHGYLYLVAEPCLSATECLVPLEDPQRNPPKNARRKYKNV